MTRASLLFISLFTAFLSACGAADTYTSNATNADHRELATVQTSDVRAAAGTSGQIPNADGSVIPTQISLSKAEDARASDRKVIRNADLNLEAADPEEAQRKIAAIAELRGGFVVESQQSASEITSTSRDIVSMTVRVPADAFSEALADIRNTSTRVVLETVKGQDVTEEFIDIEAQLKAKKALEQQFMEIMKRADTIADALHVQSQLSAVRGEIERIEGRRRFLENQSAMSTIKVRLQTAKVIAATSVAADFGDRVADSFAAGAEVALSFVLGLVTFLVAALPFALFIGLPAFAIIRYVLKRQSRGGSVIELAKEELKST